MKLDRILAALFSKRTLALILLLSLAVLSLTACTLEDVFCLFFCGVPSLATCREMIQNCNCGCGECGYRSPDGEYVDCTRSNCIGEAYNGCFGCVWEGGLKDCRPSQLCDGCRGSEDDEYDYGGSVSCDDCMLDCIDSCLYGN